MKILFSPSESKNSGGSFKPLTKESFLFEELFDKRKFALDRYVQFLENANNAELLQLFGIKNQEQINEFMQNIYLQPTLKAIQRYCGVAYDYLQYNNLEFDTQQYIDKNVIIFSNLFGPILAGDIGLPNYKLKQGENIGNFILDKYYKEHFSEALDEYFKNECIIDLRAEFYNKFYKPNIAHITLKFVKNGKIVSHFAKAYRGIVLKVLACNNVQSVDEFMSINIENLKIKEIRHIGKRTEIIYDIA